MVEVASKYPLNMRAIAMLGLSPKYFEPVWDDVPTDEDKRQTASIVTPILLMMRAIFPSRKLTVTPI